MDVENGGFNDLVFRPRLAVKCYIIKILIEDVARVLCPKYGCVLGFMVASESSNFGIFSYLGGDSTIFPERPSSLPLVCAINYFKISKCFVVSNSGVRSRVRPLFMSNMEIDIRVVFCSKLLPIQLDAVSCHLQLRKNILERNIHMPTEGSWHEKINVT